MIYDHFDHFCQNLVDSVSRLAIASREARAFYAVFCAADHCLSLPKFTCFFNMTFSSIYDQSGIP